MPNKIHINVKNQSVQCVDRDWLWYHLPEKPEDLTKELERIAKETQWHFDQIRARAAENEKYRWFSVSV